MQVNMGSRVNDMQMYNTFSVNQWSTFRRSFSLRLLTHFYPHTNSPDEFDGKWKKIRGFTFRAQIWNKAWERNYPVSLQIWEKTLECGVYDGLFRKFIQRKAKWLTYGY